MDFVIVAVMAYANPIFGIMPEIRVLVNGLDVVRFKVAIRATKTALIAVTLNYLVLPFEVLGATTALILFFVYTPPLPKAILTAKMMVICTTVSAVFQRGSCTSELLPTLLTLQRYLMVLVATLLIAEIFVLNMGRGPHHGIPTIQALNLLFLGLGFCTALTAAILPFTVRGPAFRALRNRFAALLAIN